MRLIMSVIAIIYIVVSTVLTLISLALLIFKDIITAKINAITSSVTSFFGS